MRHVDGTVRLCQTAEVETAEPEEVQASLLKPKKRSIARAQEGINSKGSIIDNYAPPPNNPLRVKIDLGF